MSEIRDLLQHDVRFIKRELRNARVGKSEVQSHYDSLSDASENARWMRPDGTPCNEAEAATLLSYHEEARGKLSFAGEKE